VEVHDPDRAKARVALSVRVAILWARFGAYHLARLKAAAEAGGAAGAEVFGIEIAQRDQYAWAHHGGSTGFERVTLFSDHDYGALAPGQIRREVTAALQRLGADVVAVNGWGTPEARAAIAWRRRTAGARAVLMSETKEDDGVRRWWKELPKGWLVRSCDAALVGGRAQEQYLEKLGFPPGRVFHGYDVVDNDYFASQAAAARADGAIVRRRFGLPVRFFFACTRFLPRKNISGLLRAYADYRKQAAEPWALVIAGSGEEEGSLRRLAADLALDDVYWPGFLQYDQLPAYFAMAGAFVHPALAEPWGLVVNEAAACGLPLLVSRTVGARYELVDEGTNGLLFDPANTDDICRALLAISTMPAQQRASMGDRSSAIAADWGPRRFGEGLFSAIAAAQPA
jgi:1,2-diacylglycerol 3-alpha-glucosyltransferase